MNSQELRNLQEEYLGVYEEGFKRLPRYKMELKRKEIYNNFMDAESDSPEETKLLKRDKKLGDILTGPTPKPKLKKEEVDLYDIILSHLLDEGYAETQEQAEVIMVNMSEEWRESICEEYKKLPVGKMMWKAVNRTEREADTRADREREANDPHSTITHDRAREEHEKAGKNKERNYKMVRVADTHSKKEAKAKSKFKK